MNSTVKIVIAFSFLLLLSACGSSTFVEQSAGGASQGFTQNGAHFLFAQSDGGCVEAHSSWADQEMPVLSAPFSFSFQATPAAKPIDGVIALSQVAGSFFSDYAALIRFNMAGTIDARNGGVYEAVETVSYEAGKSYRVWLSVFPAQKTYSVEITMPDGTSVTIAQGFAFRTEQQDVDHLANWGAYAKQAGDLEVCQVGLRARDNLPPVADAGADFSVEDSDDNGTEVVELDGTASRDFDGQIATFRWFVDGTLLAEGATPAVTLSVGVSTIDLVISDEERAVDTAQITVTVNPPGGGGGSSGCGCAGYDKPGPQNTGPYDESILVPTGSLTITQEGAVVENVAVSGTITVLANHVTIRNATVTGGGQGYGINAGYNTDVVGTTIEFVRIHGHGVGLIGSHLKAVALDIGYQQGDGIKSFGETEVTRSWIHHLGMEEGSHADGTQAHTGDNQVYTCNNFDMPIDQSGFRSNATTFFKTSSGHTLRNLFVDSNWLNGGNYTIYVQGGTGPVPENVYVRNNCIGRDYRYGLLVNESPTYYGSGNIWEDTGEPVDELND